MEASDTYKDTEKAVLEKLRVFVKVFVYFYEKSQTEHYERLQTTASKPGKFADLFHDVFGVGKGISLEILGVKAPVGGIITFPLQLAISKLGDKQNRDELKKLLVPMYEFKHHPDLIRNALVEAGIEIFQSFEAWFVQLTAHNSWERAMEKFAYDAVNRVLSFSKENFRDEVLTASFITKGIVYGKSKESFSLSRIEKAGHTVQSENSDSWNTVELFNNAGLVVIEGNENAYYRKKDKKNNVSIDLAFSDRAKSLKKLGYRRLFVWESKEHAEITKGYEKITDKVEYQYILMQDGAQKLKEQIFTEINEEDPKLVEEKIMKHFNAAIEQIKENSECDLQNLESFITQNLDIVNAFQAELNKARQENKQAHEDIKQTVEVGIDKIIQAVVGRNEGTNQPILFDVKEAFPSFTGRVKELRKLHEILQKEDGPNVPRLAAITGLGGIGKSELAKKYVSEHMKEYDSNVIWINAETDATLRESFCRLAENKLKLPTTHGNGKDKKTKYIVDDVYDQFSNNKSLFIFDNAERTGAEGEECTQGVDKFLPRRPNQPYVIITSRDQDWGEISTIRLDVMSDDEAQELIVKALEGFIQLDENETKRLAKELGNLPLALRQAVAYIKIQSDKQAKRGAERFTVAAYFQELKEITEKLLSHKQSNDAGYLKTVMNTWQIAINKIETENGTIGKLALSLLQIMAYLAPDNIGIDMFINLIDDDENMDSAVAMLDQYSLVNLQRGSVSVHRLVQTATRLHLEQLHEIEKVIDQVFHLLEFNSKNKPLISLQSHYEIFLSHLCDWIKKETTKKDEFEQIYLVHCLEEVAHSLIYIDTCKAYQLLDRALLIYEKQFGTESLEFAEKLLELSDRSQCIGDHKTAAELLDRALPIYEKQYGTESMEYAEKLLEMIHVYEESGDHKKAMELLDRTLQIYEKQNGTESLEFAEKLLEMSDVYQKSGDHKKAVKLLDRTLLIYQKQYGTESLQLAEKLSKVSFRYQLFDDHKKGMELLDRALPIYEQQYGTESLKFSEKLSEVSNRYRWSGDDKKAAELLDHTLPIYEKQYGTESLELAEKLLETSDLYEDSGDHDKAVELLDRALPIYEKQNGTETLVFAEKLLELSRSYQFNDDHKKAAELLDRALPIYEKQYGTESLEYAEKLLEMSHFYEESGDRENAVEFLERTLLIYQKQYGTESLEFAEKLLEMRYVYDESSGHEKAVELADRALPIFGKQYGTESLEFAEKLSEESNRCRWIGDHKKALELLDHILPIYEKQCGTESWEVADKLLEKSDVYQKSGDHKKAVELVDRALPIFKKQYGTESLEFAEKLLEMSDLYEKSGDHDKAVKLLDRSLAIFEKQYGNESLVFAKTLLELSGSYPFNDDHKKAMELLDRAMPIYEQQYGTESLKFAKQLSKMGSVCCRLGEHKRTVEFLGRALPIYEKEDSSEHFEVAYILFSLGNSYAHLDTNKEEEFFDRAVLVFKNLKHFSLEQSPGTQLYRLHNTLELGSLTWIKKLIDHGFNVLQSNYHDTVLHQAVAGNKEEVVRLILDEIKEKYPKKLTEAINAKDSAENTPLMWAAKGGKTNCAKILLEFGPELNTRNKGKMTALHWAVEGGHHEVLKLLLDYKADSCVKDYYGRTPLDLAKKKLLLQSKNDNLKKILDFLVENTGSQ